MNLLLGSELREASHTGSFKKIFSKKKSGDIGWVLVFLKLCCLYETGYSWEAEEMHIYVKVEVSHSVVSDSLQPRGRRSARLVCPQNSPGKNTGVGCHFLLQGIFPTQGSNPGLPHCRQLDSTIWATREAVYIYIYIHSVLNIFELEQSASLSLKRGTSQEISGNMTLAWVTYHLLQVPSE